MKTKTNNAVKEIRTGIVLIVLTLAISTAFKVKDLQVNEVNNEVLGSNRTEALHSINSTLPVLDAELIEEPALVAYNANEFAEAEMALEIKNLINGNSSLNNEASEAETTFQVRAYNANEFVEAEMAIESRMYNNSKENGTNEQIGGDNTLANN
jgi:hypothetical protein